VIIKETQIDQLVYQLYDLTEEDIKIIEEMDKSIQISFLTNYSPRINSWAKWGNG